MTSGRFILEKSHLPAALMQQMADQLKGVSSPVILRCYGHYHADEACHILTRLAETASTLLPTYS